MKHDIAQQITDRVIAMIESGQANGSWTPPWKSYSAFPVNATTRKGYRGVNILLLWSAQDEFGYRTSAWATFNQWKQAGYRLQDAKGRGQTIVFWKMLEITDKVTGEPKKIPMLKWSTVFNAEHAIHAETGLPFASPSSDEEIGSITSADDVIAQSGARITHQGSRAFYRRSEDRIYLPPRGEFLDTEGYYSTALHELVHWTGHESRLDRKFGARFGDDAYAFEELVAELGSAFLCAHVGIDMQARTDHANYIQSWLTVLRGDKHAIMTAASAATKALDLLTEESAQLEAAA